MEALTGSGDEEAYNSYWADWPKLEDVLKYLVWMVSSLELPGINCFF